MIRRELFKRGHGHANDRVSNFELTKRILGRGVFSYSRILSDSFVQSTVIQNLNSYANTPVWKVLYGPI